MNITLVGFGKMGRMIASRIEPPDRIVSIVDPTAPEATHKAITQESLVDTDVVIDFSNAASVLITTDAVASLKRNLIVGTTGWGDQLPTVKSIVEQSGIGFLHSSNFSIGVQLFFKLIERAGECFAPFEEYDVFAHEFHHRKKADSPSGTALSLGQILLKTMPRKTELLTHTAHEKISPHQLHLTSTRGGSVPGTHGVFFDSEADTIEIRHTARSRRGFADGALKAAAWIEGKSGFFTMEDYVEEISNVKIQMTNKDQNPNQIRFFEF